MKYNNSKYNWYFIAAIIQYNRNKINNTEQLTSVILNSSFWFLLIDKLILHTRKKKNIFDKNEASENIKLLTDILNSVGVDVEINDVVHSIKEKINNKTDYFYMIDKFNNIVPVCKRTENVRLFRKRIIYEEGLDGYNYISFTEIGSIATDEKNNIRILNDNEKDDIRILSTEGDIDKKDIKEKYLKIGLLLQSLEYKNSSEINEIIKKKLIN